jgi:hypothetical protein
MPTIAARGQHNGGFVGWRVSFVVATLAILLAAGAAGAGPSADKGEAAARAIAVRVIVPGGAGGGTREVTAPPDAAQFVGGFAYGDGGAFRTGGVSASASAAVTSTTASARASVDVSGITLFGGEVTIGRVSARAAANGRGEAASGGTGGSAVSGLVVHGQGVPLGPGSTAALGDWGQAVALVGGSATTGRSHRSSVTALEIRLVADYGGLPAGTVISIGYAEASATAPPPPPPPPPPPAKPKPKATGGATKRGEKAPQPAEEPPATPRAAPSAPPVRRNVPLVQPQLTKSGYVFPVYGPASFANTFGAARATTGWHHGEDIFAPMGAPVLAVADGVVFSVGWNDVGGNRFWLRDKKGNEFYYAHLSAFSPLAVNGAQVTAGDVLGFVGTSGDAEGTPPHLHFEIHPVELLHEGYDGVIDPNPYLVAWRRLDDVPRFVVGSAVGSRWLAAVAPVSNTPTPGAFLLSSSDISTANGLAPGSLDHALREPLSAADGDAGRSEDDAPAETAGRTG